MGFCDLGFTWNLSIETEVEQSMDMAGKASRMTSFQKNRSMQTMKKVYSVFEWFCTTRGKDFHGIIIDQDLG